MFSTLLPAPADATQGIPYRVNFQGRLTDNNGNILADGFYNMTFRIADDPTLSGGHILWTEDREVVSGPTDLRVHVVNGLFSVQLGEVTALSPTIFNSSSLRYLEIELPSTGTNTCGTVGCASWTEGPFTPRHIIGASPYAFVADTLDGLDSTAFSQLTAANTFTGTNTFSKSGGAGIVLSGTPASGGSLLQVGSALSSGSSSGTLIGANGSFSGDLLNLQVGNTTKLIVDNSGNLTAGTINGMTISGGTVSSGTWQGTAVDAAHGGTGQGTYAVGDLLYASTTSALSRLADIASGSCLLSGGVSTAPAWGACPGGSGASTTLNNLGTTAINASLIPGSNNSIDLGSAADVWANLKVANIDAGSTTHALAIGGSTDTTSVAVGRSGVQVSTPGGLNATATNVNSTSTTGLGVFSVSAATVDSAATGGTDETHDHTYEGFKFNTGTSTNIGDVRVNIKKDGGVTDGSYVIATLYTDSSGSPGTALGASGAVYAFGISSSYSQVDFGFNEPGLSAGTSYWIIFTKTVSGGNFYFDSTSGTNSYAFSTNGTSWTLENKKLVFIITSATNDALQATSDNGFGVRATSINGAGVQGNSTNGNGLEGNSNEGVGVSAYSDSGYAIDAYSTQGTGILAQSEAGNSGLFLSGYSGNTAATLVTRLTTGGTADLFQAQDASSNPILSVSYQGNLTVKNIVQTKDVSASSTNSDALTLRTGNSTTSGNTGNVTLNSGNATSGNSGNIVIDTGTASGTKGTVTIGGTNATSITLGNSGATVLMPGSTLQHAAAGTFTVDAKDAGADTTVSVTNSDGTKVANLDVEGNINVGSGKVYKVGGTSGSTISTCGAGNYVSSFASTGGIVTGGTCTTPAGTYTFNVTGDSGGSTAIASGNTVTIQGGNGLTTTNSSGTVSVDVGAGTGISVAANSVAVDQAFSPTWTGAQTFTPSSTNNVVVNGDNDSNFQIASTIGAVTENPMTLSATYTGDATSNGIGLTITDNASASTGTIYGLSVTNADNGANTGVPDALGYLKNANAAETVPDGLLVEQTGAGALTSGLEVKQSAGTLTNGLTFTGTFSKYINSTNFNVTNAGAVTTGSTINSQTIGNASSFVTSVTAPTINGSTVLQYGGNDINTGGGSPTLSNVDYLDATQTLSAKKTFSAGGVGIVLSGTPSTGASILQIASALSSGSTNGTLIGANTATSADLVNLQVSNSIKLKVDNSGNTTVGGSLTLGSGSVAAFATTGLIQNAAFDNTLAYTNIVKVGALTSGSIASGFGTIATTNSITTSSNISTTGSGTLTSAGTLTGNGTALFEDATNSTSALQVQNASAGNVLAVDTTGLNGNAGTTPAGNNLLGNTSVETAIAAANGNWQKLLATGTVTQDSTANNAYNGANTLKFASTATANEGVKQVIASALATTTKYTLNFYAKRDTGTVSMTDLQVGYSYDSTAAHEVNCTTNTATVISSGWTKISCSFLTGSAGTAPTATQYVYMRKTGATAETWYMDSFTLETDTNNDTNYREGKITLQAAVVSPLILQNSSNSVNALTVQNTGGTNIFNVDTTDTNLISNPSFEAGTTGWSVVTSTMARDTSRAYSGQASLQSVNSAQAGGAQFALNTASVLSTLINTQYTVSFYVQLVSGSVPSFTVTYSPEGTTTTDTCAPSGTAVTGGWVRFSCAIAADNTHTPANGGYLKIAQASATSTWNIDAVQMEAAGSASAYADGAFILNGTISSPSIFQNATNSTTAFQIQNAAGTTMFNADTLNGAFTLNNATLTVTANGNSSWTTSSGTLTIGAASTLILGDSTNGMSFDATTHEPTLTGTAMHTRTIELSPEYAGATFTADGSSNTGTLTSDNQKSSPFHNYYQWTTTQGTAQDYDIWVRVPLPADFSSIPTGQTVCLDTFASALTANGVTMQVYDTSNTAVFSPNPADLTPTSATNSWENKCTGSISGGTYTLNGSGFGYINLDIKMTAPATTGNIEIGDITFKYKSKF